MKLSVSMVFNYEQSIWGKGYASLSTASPTSFRLRQALRAVQNLPAGARVLELGCGAGQFIRSIKKIRPDLACYGCDISASAIAEAEKMDDGVQYVHNESALPYENDFFDAVLIFDVLEHVTDIDLILREVKRTLKSGGVFYTNVPCEGDSLSLWSLLRRFGIKGDLTRKYAGHINYFTRRGLRNAFEHHGFSEIVFRYSEHVLGQLLGVAAFSLMDRSARRQGLTQINGEEYFASLDQSVAAPGLFQFFKRCVNRLVFAESWLLSRVPSPNVHAVMTKQ